MQIGRQRRPIYRTADELPDELRVLAPIIEEVPKLLDEASQP